MAVDSTTIPAELFRPTTSKRIILSSALITLFTLLGGLAAGLIGGSLAHFGLPDSMAETTRIGISALPGLAGAFLGGMLWGWAMARLVAPDRSRRMTWAGGLGFGPTFIVVALILTALELILVQRGAINLPIHVVFIFLFVPAAALIAAAGALALGITLHDRRLAIILALAAGLASGLAFLVAVLLMDSIGYRVGAPGAAQKATMITVLFVGIVASALAGGAVVGWILVTHKPRSAKTCEV